MPRLSLHFRTLILPYTPSKKNAGAVQGGGEEK